MACDTTSIYELPNEILFKILLNLNPQDLQQQCRASKKFRDLCNSDYFWRLRFKQDYPQYYSMKDMTGQYKNGWKTFYQLSQVSMARGKSPGQMLQYSANYGRPDDVKILLSYSISSSHCDDAIRWASEEGYVEVVKLLLQDRRANPAARANYALREAAENKHLKVLKLLLEDGRADPGVWGNEIIKLASKKGNVEVVKILLADDRVDPGASDNYAFRKAAKNKHPELIEILLADKRVDPRRHTDIIKWAAKHGHFKIVKLLLSNEKIHLGDRYNWAIVKAARYNHIEIAKLLLADQRLINHDQAYKWAATNVYRAAADLLRSIKQ